MLVLANVPDLGRWTPAEFGAANLTCCKLLQTRIFTNYGISYLTEILSVALFWTSVCEYCGQPLITLILEVLITYLFEFYLRIVTSRY